MRLIEFLIILTVLLFPVFGVAGRLECNLPAISGRFSDYTAHNWPSEASAGVNFVVMARNNDNGEPIPAAVWAYQQGGERSLSVEYHISSTNQVWGKKSQYGTPQGNNLYYTLTEPFRGVDGGLSWVSFVSFINEAYFASSITFEIKPLGKGGPVYLTWTSNATKVIASWDLPDTIEIPDIGLGETESGVPLPPITSAYGFTEVTGLLSRVSADNLTINFKLNGISEPERLPVKFGEATSVSVQASLSAEPAQYQRVYTATLQCP